MSLPVDACTAALTQNKRRTFVPSKMHGISANTQARQAAADGFAPWSALRMSVHGWHELS
jgi:hypothetical protein